MLGLSFVYLYEEVNYLVPIEYFAINATVENYPETVNTYAEMTEGSQIVGKVDGTTVISGQVVYTGWILTSQNQWIHCAKFGKMLFHRVFREEYEAFQNNLAEKGEPALDGPTVIATITAGRATQTSSIKPIKQNATSNAAKVTPLATTLNDGQQQQQQQQQQNYEGDKTQYNNVTEYNNVATSESVENEFQHHDENAPEIIHTTATN
jgi:hypothetical protein